MASKHHEKQLDLLLTGAYGKTWEDRSSIEKELPKYRQLVLECCESKHLVGIYVCHFRLNYDFLWVIFWALCKLKQNMGRSEWY